MSRKCLNEGFLYLGWVANVRLRRHFSRKSLGDYCRRHARAHAAMSAWIPEVTNAWQWLPHRQDG